MLLAVLLMRNTNATANLTEIGKAPAPDTNIVRNIKDAVAYGEKGLAMLKVHWIILFLVLISL